MPTTFYIDESGHSGDAVKSGNAYDFKDQPFFVLAAVGVEDEVTLAAKILELRDKHRIAEGEMKAKSLLNKPEFVCDLLEWACGSGMPVFAELVDKKYFLCMNIVTTQVVPPSSGLEDSIELNMFRNHLADFLYAHAPDDLFDRFVRSCLEPGSESLRHSFQSQIDFGRAAVHHGIAIGDFLAKMSAESLDDFETLLEDAPDAFMRFLPPPDRNKRGKLVWMLPNLTSFTHIYARINRYRQGRVGDVRIVHDVQLEIEDILREGKRLSEALRKLGEIPITPHADFRFEEAGSLEFGASHESSGIQTADVLAGAVMRFFRAHQKGDGAHAASLARGVAALLLVTDADTGRGLNQVVPTHNVLHVARADSSEGE